MSAQFLIQFAIVLVCILLGARAGGIGLGVFGGLGLAILTFGFGLQPTSPPIDVMLMIMAVVSAAAAMEASGGLDLMIRVATRILRKNPKYITFMAPAVTYMVPVTLPIPCCPSSQKSRAAAAYARNARFPWQSSPRSSPSLPARLRQRSRLRRAISRRTTSASRKS